MAKRQVSCWFKHRCRGHCFWLNNSRHKPINSVHRQAGHRCKCLKYQIICMKNIVNVYYLIKQPNEKKTDKTQMSLATIMQYNKSAVLRYFKQRLCSRFSNGDEAAIIGFGCAFTHWLILVLLQHLMPTERLQKCLLPIRQQRHESSGNMLKNIYSKSHIVQAGQRIESLIVYRQTDGCRLHQPMAE